MLELVKYITLFGALAVSTFSRKWCLVILVMFLPLTQWMPEIPLPGINALNLLLLPVLARALFGSSRKPSKSGSEPLRIPIAVLLILLIISWARVHFSSTLPVAFLRADGLYNNIVTLKEFCTAFILYNEFSYP